MRGKEKGSCKQYNYISDFLLLITILQPFLAFDFYFRTYFLMKFKYFWVVHIASSQL